MKSIRQLTVLFLCTLVLFGFLYPVLIWGIGRLTPHNANGRPITLNGRIVGYENIGQLFTGSDYFHGRPSASDYNADPSAATNYGPTNPILLKDIHERIDTLISENQGITAKNIPSDLVTSSGSGLDPDISPQGAYLQVARVAKNRGLPESKVLDLVKQHIKGPLFGFLGPSRVNVLKLNIALDKVKPESP
ncbi:MAG TPA: potassium-transporting ATPase subunit KdpC [Balneolales bacterium]|nr:potassium-transporting ATPase subunit KdpC [Balneolales bacterium]